MGKRNLVYVLNNGFGPSAWSIATVEEGQTRYDALWVGVFEVSDDLAEKLRGPDEPRHHWEEIAGGKHWVLDWNGSEVVVHEDFDAT